MKNKLIDQSDIEQYQMEEEKTAAYIVDEELRIVFANDELRRRCPDLQYGEYCYKIFCNASGQCINCPLRAENQGKAVVFSQIHQEYVSVSSAKIAYPGARESKVILLNTMTDREKTSFYNTIYKSDYDELLELNYLTDTYNVFYHSGRKESRANTTGRISEMVRYVAERVIHPEDRQRFYEFWALDRLGKEVAPRSLLKPQQARFRRLLADGSYEMAEQIFIPARQGTDGELYLMSFYNPLNNLGTGNPQAGGIHEQVNEKGILEKAPFFGAVERILHAADDQIDFCLLSIDIENLKLFNEWYGREEGNHLIAGVANCLQKMSDSENCVVGYFGNDDFGLLMPNEQAKVERLVEELGSLLETYSNKIGFLPAVGMYEITDRMETVSTMYDRAELARSAVKGNYSNRIKKFDQKMLEDITSKYILFSDVKRALREKEFTFFLQPKCNIHSGKIVGAEALVRWKNKNGEMISPAVFIPFLESSGFIAELDPYIWEEVCIWQRKMLDRGIETIPISVNVSRVDIYSMDVPACFQQLVQTYALPPDLIEIEITESTYTEGNDRISKVVTDLRQAGFRVLMDDFGSGYSSLNMLKDVEFDVLKIDMRFLDVDEDNQSKGVGILQAIHNMSNLMGTDVIVEGLETEQQKKFLQKMGCSYAQGYYFYRPMPTADFEEIIRDPENLGHMENQQRHTEQIYLRDLLSENMFNEIMINNMLGAVAFYDVSEEGITVRRYNDLYAEQVGTPAEPGEKLNLSNYLYEEDIPAAMKMFQDARESLYEGVEAELRRIRKDGSVVWLQLRTFFLKEQDGHALYYSAIRDVTDIHQKNKVLEEQNLALRFLNDDMPGGYFRYKYNEDAQLLFVSPRFLDILGFTRTELAQRFQNKYINLIHPDDRKIFRHGMQSLVESSGDYSLTYRVLQKNGYIVVTEQSRYVEYEEHKFFQGIILYDLHQTWPTGGTNRFEADQFDLNYVPCGIYQAEVDGERKFRYVSNSMLAMLGYTRQEFLEKFKCVTDLVAAEDLPMVGSDILEQLKHSTTVSCEHRIELVDGSRKWVYSCGRIIVDDDGKRLFNVITLDGDHLKAKYRDHEWQHLKYKSLAEIPGMLVFDYEPNLDRMTIELSQADRTLKTLVSDRFIENMSQHPWLAKDKIAEQRARLFAATKQAMNGTTEFKAQLSEEGGFQWYRSHFQSIADEYGTVYRIVGRADRIDDRKVQQKTGSKMVGDWTFYENLDEAVYVCDMETYELEYLNHRCLQDCGAASLEEVKGKKCYEVLQKCSTPCAICTNKYLKPGQFYEWKYANPIHQKSYLLKDTVIERDGRRFRMELAVDISAQEQQKKLFQDYVDHEIMVNEGLRIALSQETTEQSIMVLLEHLGRYLKSERAYIFEELQEGLVTNTYEWCGDGISAEKQNLQQIPIEVVAPWYRNYRKHENVIVYDLEDIRESDPLTYQYLKPQNIRSLVTSPIFDHGKIIGFFGVDNAPGELLENISMLLEILGHFIASLLKREALLRRLEYLSYFDKLTGLKNRRAMDEYLDTFVAGESIGVVYLDVMGLKTINDTRGHQNGDELLQRVGECLNRNFAGREQFRVGGDEFLVLCKGITQQEILQQIELLREDMRKSDIIMAVGYVWEPHYTNNIDLLLKEADTQMYKDKKLYYAKS